MSLDLTLQQALNMKASKTLSASHNELLELIYQ